MTSSANDYSETEHFLSGVACTGGSLQVGLFALEIMMLNAVEWLWRLYNLATEYGDDRPAKPTAHSMAFLREYNSMDWKVVNGGVDESYTTFVQVAGMTRFATFRDPKHYLDIEVSIRAVAWKRVFLKGQAPGTDTNRTNLAGSGGDWMLV